MAIGPGGTRDSGLGGPQVRSVACDGYGITVQIDAPEAMFFRDFMRVTLMERHPAREWQVEIRGGNTNDGDLARYEEAIRIYGDAVKVAKNLLVVVNGDPDSMFEGYDDDVLLPVASSFPDYMLAAFLMVHKAPSFAYMRDAEPNDNPDFYSLDRLRSRVVEVVRAKVEVG